MKLSSMAQLLRRKCKLSHHTITKRRLLLLSALYLYTIFMHVYLFGNPDLEMDSLPLQLLPKLREQFPDITFTVLDPNEEWDVERDMVIIDTVVGIEKVTVFESLEAFSKTPRVTCHDFDAYTNLLFLKKLGKVSSVKILGVPPSISQDRALEEIKKFLV